MRVISFIVGLIVIMFFSSALCGIEWGGYKESSMLDIRNNIPLSTAILLLSIMLLITLLYRKYSVDFIAGTLCGLAGATFFVGFETDVGFAVIFYAILCKSTFGTHNKFKNEDASEAVTDAQKDARPF